MVEPMTSNSDLVQQANKDHQLLPELGSKSVQHVPRRKALDLDEQTREETIRLVRQLFFSGPSIPQAVIFSGVEHGCGCTSVCARAAKTLAAHVDGLVCVVDADLRTPSLHRYFGIQPSSDFVEGELLHVPIRRKEHEPSNLWLLSDAGANSPMPQRFDRLKSRISDLRSGFTYILIDAPPINAYADTPQLGGMADGLVMILGANNTRREAALKAKDSLNAAGVRLLGAVLNKRTFPIPDKLYWKL